MRIQLFKEQSGDYISIDGDSKFSESGNIYYMGKRASVENKPSSVKDQKIPKSYLDLCAIVKNSSVPEKWFNRLSNYSEVTAI